VLESQVNVRAAAGCFAASVSRSPFGESAMNLTAAYASCAPPSSAPSIHGRRRAPPASRA